MRCVFLLLLALLLIGVSDTNVVWADDHTVKVAPDFVPPPTALSEANSDCTWLPVSSAG